MRKNILNRLLSVLLVVATLLSLLPVSASATEIVEPIIMEEATPSDSDTHEITEDVHIKRDGAATTALSDFSDVTVAPPVEAAADVLQPLYGAICEALTCDGDGILATSIYNAFKQQLQRSAELYSTYNSGEAMANADLQELETQVGNALQVLNAYLQTVKAMQSADGIEAELNAAMDALAEPVAVNEYVNIAEVGTTNLAGYLFIVNELKDANGESVYFALDPITPSYYGKMTAKRVELIGDISTGVAALTGLHPEMALEFQLITEGKADYYARICGEYEEDLSTDTYLNCKARYGSSLSADTDKYYTDLVQGTLASPDSAFGVLLRSWNKVSLTYSAPIDNTTTSYYQYPALNTLDPSEEVYFEINANTSGAIGASTYQTYPNYYAGREDQVSSYLFRLLTDRIYTEQLRDAAKSYEDMLNSHAFYDEDTYTKFKEQLQQMIVLYNEYNGVVLQDEALENKAAIEEELLELQEEMISTAGVLRINTNGTAGTQIKTFEASMYRWNEDQVNAINAAADTGTTKKGFYFTETSVPGITKDNLPRYSKWLQDSGDVEMLFQGGKMRTVSAQQYAIYSGLALANMAGKSSPMDTSVVIDAADIWNTTPSNASDGTPIREVYNNVNVPFMYDVDSGYYTLDSDTNAVYFDGEPKDYATLKIADLPITFTRDGSVEAGDNIISGNRRTYGLYTEYCTGLQPFAEISTRLWKGFRADSPYFGDSSSSKVDGYLAHGVAETKNYTTAYGYLGNQNWGFGMQLEIRFKMTEDGTLDGQPITFEFSGDDDVWVYIDDQLVLDIGGTHDAIQGKIDFSTGTVYVRSDKYTYIRDNNPSGYGRDTSLYSLSSVVNYDPDGGTNYIAYGSGLSHMSVTGMKDGSTPVRIYQKNLYSGDANGVAATADLISAFAAGGENGEHVLKVFYMDRGRGKTNCKMTFNLPQTDKLVVEKEFNDYYADGENGLTDERISESLMQKLLNSDFGFTVYSGNAPLANTVYHIVENGNSVGTGMTDENGHFTIKGKQTAEFRGAEFTVANAYSVVEDDLGSDWAEPTYVFDYSGITGADAIPPASGEGNGYSIEGNPFIAETLTVTCTNTYARYAPIEADPVDVVIDYAKPVEVDVRRRAVAAPASELQLMKAPMRAELADPNDAIYGDFELFDSDGNGQEDSLRYTTQDFLSKIITINCIFDVTFDVEGVRRDIAVPVRIIPATSVYYETDFSEKDAITLNSYGATSERSQWTTEGTATEEVQDSGTIKDTVHDFVFDRAGDIPSNAFFADFTNDSAATARYSKHPTYRNVGAANTYVNYDVASNWICNKDRNTLPTIDTGTGTLKTVVLSNTESAYFQTGPNLQASFALNYHPQADHYFRMRFKMKNLVSTRADGTFELVLPYYIGSNHTEDKNDGVERGYTAARTTLSAEVLTNEEYVTVTLPLSAINANHTKITALRVTFNGIKNKSTTEQGEISVDYIYYGPSMSKTGTRGMNYEYQYMPYLYFNFSNTVYDQKRYTNSAYGGIKDYDTNKSRWVVATQENKSNGSNVNFSAEKFSGGVATFKVGPRKNSDGQYGSYIAPSKNAENFPWAGDTGDYCMNFVPNKSLTYYGVVRFRLTGCKQVSGQQAKLQFSLIDSSNNIKHPAVNFTFSNGNWILAAVPISASLNGLGSTIKSFYVRVANVTTNSVTTYGYIEIDYIYVGTGQNYDFAYNYSSNENAAFIDFRNTAYDKARYDSRTYGSNNFDVASGWYNTYWYNYSINTSTGILKLTPTADYEGWGQIEANDSARKTFMSYRMTGNAVCNRRQRQGLQE